VEKKVTTSVKNSAAMENIVLFSKMARKDSVAEEIRTAKRSIFVVAE
jgi:hypothetical protein